MREFKMSHEWNVPATPPDPHSYYSDEPHFYPQVTEAQAYGQGFYPDNELVRRPPFGGLAGGLLAGTLVNAFDEGPYYPGPGYGPYPGPYQPYY